jgi:transposase
MAYIRYQKTKSGKLHAYQITASWNSQKKQSRSTSKYLGVVGGDDGRIIPKGSSPIGRPKKAAPAMEQEEVALLDFGDSFLITQSIKESAIYTPLKHVFEKMPALLPLMAYRLVQPGPMYNAPFWLEGNALKISKQAFSLSSQNISQLLACLGEESLQSSFFNNYLAHQYKQGPKNIIIDATSLPNQINSSFNAWGYDQAGIQKQFRFHCVVDQTSKKPLFYRYVPGNLPDVASLQVTIQELQALGVKQSFALVDAGFCSQANIDLLREHSIDFLTRLPAGRRLFKDMVQAHAKSLESLQYATLYGKRSLFVRALEIDQLYGKQGHVYIVLDPEKKAKQIQQLITERYSKQPGEIDQLKDEASFLEAGIFIFISSKSIDPADILQAYYTRQSIEQIFGFAKEDLEILPIRCHKEETIRGYFFLQFLLLIVFVEIRDKLKGMYTVEQALMITRGLKCKVFPSNILVQDLTKHQKKIFELLSIIVPSLVPEI